MMSDELTGKEPLFSSLKEVRTLLLKKKSNKKNIYWKKRYMILSTENCQLEMLLTYLPETPELATKPLILSTSIQDGSTFTSL